MNSIAIKRERISVDHTAQAKTSFREEILFQALKDGVDSIFIIKNMFMANLRVFDSDGEELAVISGEQTIDLLKSTNGRSEGDAGWADQMIDDMQEERVHLIWILFPPHKELKKSQSKVLRLEYDSLQEQKPSSKITLNYADNGSHPIFYKIRRPDGYGFKTKQAELRGGGGPSRTIGLSPGTHPLTVRETFDSLLLEVRPHTIPEMTVTYSFGATRNILFFPYFAIGLLSAMGIVTGLVGGCVTAQCWWLEHPHIAGLAEHRIQIAAGIIAASLVLPRLIQNESVRHGHKFSFLAPVAIAIIPPAAEILHFLLAGG